MSGQWYYNQDGAQYGPVDESEIVRLLRDGELASGTPVLKVGSMDWQPARAHACFQVEIYPKKKRPPVQVPAATASTTASGGTSQAPSPKVATVVVQEKSALSWVLAVIFGVAALIINGKNGGKLWKFKTGKWVSSSTVAAALVRIGVVTAILVLVAVVVSMLLRQAPADSKLFQETKTQADRGNATAQFNLGVMHAEGKGAAKDEKEAVEWFLKAAEQGYAEAQDNLGVMYRDGRGVAKDEVEAVRWFRKAAEQGLAHAQGRLGYMYRAGLGVPMDYMESSKWARKAAEQGDCNGLGLLGDNSLEGHGMGGHVEAYKWFLLAKERKYPWADPKISDLESTLTSQQKAEGQRLAREWKLQWWQKVQEPK